MADNNFSNTVDTLFKGMETFVSSKTVVGEAIKVDSETTILPLIDVSFGVGAGAYAKEAKKSNGGGGGLGGKISPNAVLVIRNGETRIINIKNQDLVTKAFEVVPELINKVKKKNEKDDVDMEVEEIVNELKDNYNE
jgi:uncharacterized spore protein YtfJ